MPRKFTCEHCGAVRFADPKNSKQRFCGYSCSMLHRPPAVPRRPLEERFWEKVVKGDDCWLWTGSTDGHGYGTINPGGRGLSPLKAHRVSLEIYLGRPIREGMGALHHCDNLPCVRPDHLFEGTQADNAADMVAKQRSTAGRPSLIPGELHVLAKLNDTAVREIRARYALGGIGAPRLAREYGVSTKTVQYVLIRKTWKHV